MSFDDQINRIKEKLIIAKEKDAGLKVFGAGRHKYVLNKTATINDIRSFENSYSIDLPECFKSFMTNIGNGGAGPFYGIYSLGEGLNEITSSKAKEYLGRDCIISPEISESYWLSLNKKIDENEDISNDDYEKELGRIFGGILPIGNQGCTYYHGIILNGDHKGKVVNLDSDRQKPQFTYEKNFLDWYERWLDEIISGDLLEDGPSWFGYLMGGTGSELIQKFLMSDSETFKSGCLASILKLKSIEYETVKIIEQQLSVESEHLRIKLIELLVKFDYEIARPHLYTLLTDNLLCFFQFICWYAPDKSQEWLSVAESEIDKINDSETLRFYILLLEKAGVDYGPKLVPFTYNVDMDTRVTAFYNLGRLKNKKDYLDHLIRGLYDESNPVVHTSLQALSGLKDWQLFNHYREIARRFTKDEHSILTKLNSNLRVFGYDNISILENSESNKVEKKWYRFW